MFDRQFRFGEIQMQVLAIVRKRRVYEHVSLHRRILDSESLPESANPKRVLQMGREIGPVCLCETKRKR